jgi:hypothetical protein
MTKAHETQVGGTHYSAFSIQPTEYIIKNKLDWWEGNIVKYISRHKLKGGAVDVQKVIHYAQMLLEDTYGITSEINYIDPSQEVPKQKKRRKKRKVVVENVVVPEQTS